MKRQILTFLFLVLSGFSLQAQNTSEDGQAVPAGAPIPQWLLDDWAARTAGTGTWITDNSAYKNENEPFDAYGLQWAYGIGKKHLNGRLYCIRDGKDIGAVWQFLEFWDPAAGEARIVQIGSDGTVGQGLAAGRWQRQRAAGIHQPGRRRLRKRPPQLDGRRGAPYPVVYHRRGEMGEAAVLCLEIG